MILDGLHAQQGGNAMVFESALEICRIVPDQILVKNPAFIERGRVVNGFRKPFFKQFFALKLEIAAKRSTQFQTFQDL